MTTTASNLSAAGWTRHFLEKTKWNTLKYIWKHPDRDGEFTYQQAMSAYAKERRGGMTRQEWKKYCRKEKIHPSVSG